jgi:hypothetical protein
MKLQELDRLRSDIHNQFTDVLSDTLTRDQYMRTMTRVGLSLYDRTVRVQCYAANDDSLGLTPWAYRTPLGLPLKIQIVDALNADIEILDQMKEHATIIKNLHYLL